MPGEVREILAGINTVGDMVAAFRDEERCRRLPEAMIWPRGRICPPGPASISARIARAATSSP